MWKHRINDDNNFHVYILISVSVPFSVLVSLLPVAHAQAKPKPTVRVNPQSSIYTGDTITLSCELQEMTGWGFFYYNQWFQRLNRKPANSFKVTVNNAGETEYRCQARTKNYNNYYDYYTEYSEPVKITVNERPHPVLSVSPQNWLTEGDSVTLSCEVTDSSTDWTFSWYTAVPYRDGVTATQNTHGFIMYVELLSDSSRGSGGSYTLSPSALHHTGVYVCRGERGEPVSHTLYSNPQPLWISVSLIISPSRTQHFTRDSLSLSCEDQSNSTGWTVRRYTDSERVLDCSWWRSVKGTTCNISFLYTSYTGVYWCESESGENSNPVNITVHDGHVILESSVHPVTEGHPLTLHCLYRNTNPSNLRADFYKDGSVVQNQTTGEMIIHKVSKSDEGFYHCKHPERGESPRSWISVRRESPPVSLIISPNRTQHFTRDSLSLSCEDQSNSTGWTVRRYTDSEGVLDCSQWGSVTGSTCNISFLSTSYTGVYWCESESGENSNPVNITVHDGDVILESPVHPVTEGHPLTLHCLYRNTNPSNLRADFYKDGSVVQNQTTGEMMIHKVSKSDEGFYHCKHPERGESPRSWISVRRSHKAVVSMKPDTHVFIGETVTLRCEIQNSRDIPKIYSWYKNKNRLIDPTEQNFTIQTVRDSDSGYYTCGESSLFQISDTSEAVTMTVSAKPKPTVRVNPQSSVYTGDTITLSCELQSTGWEIQWHKNNQQLQPQNSEQANTLNMTVINAEETEYTCRARRRNYKLYYTEFSDPVKVTARERPQTVLSVSPQNLLNERDPDGYTLYSNPQPLWITGESPPVSLIISPSRTQHFTRDSLSLSCEDQSNSTGWTVRRYTDSEGVLDCSQWGSVTGSTCNISFLSTSYTGVYWCESESGENSNPVNITVHGGDVILESSVHPVTEGHPLTLHCLYRNTNPSNLRADFYKDGSVVQNQTTGEMIIHKVSKSDEGFYHCKHPERGESPRSWISVRRSHKAVVSMKPDTHVFIGETVTLRCEIQNGRDIPKIYSWYKNKNRLTDPTEQTFTIQTVRDSDSGYYTCGESSLFQSSDTSEAVTMTVSERPQAVLSVSPQNWLTEGDSVTLSCEVTDSSTDWTFSWYTVVPYRDGLTEGQINHGYIMYVELLSDSTRGSGGNHTLSPSALHHTGVYVCRGERGEPVMHTLYSNSQPLWISGESPPVSLIISPSRTQHFTRDSLSLSCEDQSISTGWTVRRYTDSEGVLDCSQWGSVTGSTCNISFLSTNYTGVYWCESKSGENSSRVNITVHDGGVILESSVHPVTEGHPLTLHCLYRNTNPSKLRADFYKDGSVVQNQTTGEMIIHKVSKSDEGFYHCKHPERGESPRSWISVRYLDSKFSVETGVVVGLSLVFVFIVLLILMILLWCCKMKKEKQQKSSQTSEQNQRRSGAEDSQSGHKPLQTGADAQLDNNDVTYAEVQLKPMKKAKRAQGGRPHPVLSVSPQNWLTEGDSVTLSCEVTDSSTDWTFSWYTVVPYRDGVTAVQIHHDSIMYVELLSDSSRGSGGNYTLSPSALHHTGVYVCRGERGEPVSHILYSNPQPLWISGESPPVSLIISPSRTQHFTDDSLSLSCEDQSNSTGWTVRRYTESKGVLDCSQWGSVTGSTCNISFLSTSYTGVYWCESESGENSNPVNITVHEGDVILESSVHPVTEGHPLTLHCLYRNTNPSNLRADFYKDGSVVQNQTTGEIIIHKVSKSDEGFYHCKHPERGESPRSWISVRRPSHVEAPFSVLMLISSVVTASPYLLITIILLVKCYRARAHTDEDRIENAVIEE
ncbi:hypothetical protein HF521_020034 [Silurus meridionalis]|uniref:Ig-like domain-containing protein n=1 Tax=Silurus meridionalis TaxID=175797 RepID=A0A8T0BN36_SILME|nr:hypothetical protein HF521_020034 [Silurus meridionalis]